MEPFLRMHFQHVACWSWNLGLKSMSILGSKETFAAEGYCETTLTTANQNVGCYENCCPRLAVHNRESGADPRLSA